MFLFGARRPTAVGPFQGSCGRVAPLRSTSWFAVAPCATRTCADGAAFQAPRANSVLFCNNRRDAISCVSEQIGRRKILRLYQRIPNRTLFA